MNRHLKILHRYAISWSNIIHLITTIRETGGNPDGTPLEKAAFYFRMYISLREAEERDMMLAKGKLCPECLQEMPHEHE